MDERKVRVSVIIPVYNVEKYLDACIESVCNQEMRDIEIIVVDDGSTDGSAAICKEWADRDTRIRLLYQRNQGVSLARNNGIKAAMGDWIAFVDSDDWLSPVYLSTLYQTAVRDDVDVSICGLFYDYPDREIRSGHFPNDMLFRSRDDIRQIQLQILAKNMSRIAGNSGDRIGAPWCKLYRTSFVRDNELSFIPNLRRSQDVLFTLYALEKAKRISYINQPLYHYRIIEGSVCNKFSSGILTNVNAYLAEMAIFLKHYHTNDRQFEDAFNTKVCTSVYKCMFLYFFNEQYPYSVREMKKELYAYLGQEVFRKALSGVRYRNLDATEKAFVFCLKHGMLSALRLLVKIRQRFIKIFRR